MLYGYIKCPAEPLLYRVLGIHDNNNIIIIIITLLSNS